MQFASTLLRTPRFADSMIPLEPHELSHADVDASLAAAAIADQFTDAGLRLLVNRDDAVVAEQPVTGEPNTWRRIVCQAQAPGKWRVAYCVARGRYQHDLVARRIVTELLELGLFVGGCLSTPISPVEVSALQSGLPLKVASDELRYVEKTHSASRITTVGRSYPIGGNRYVADRRKYRSDGGPEFTCLVARQVAEADPRQRASRPQPFARSQNRAASEPKGKWHRRGCPTELQGRSWRRRACLGPCIPRQVPDRPKGS